MNRSQALLVVRTAHPVGGQVPAALPDDRTTVAARVRPVGTATTRQPMPA